VNSDWKEKALELAKQGVSGRQIAKIVGKSKSRVNEYLAYLRSTGEYKPIEAFSNGVGVLVSPDGKKAGSGFSDAFGKPRVLVIDIETRQMLLGGFGLFNQNFSLDQIEEDWSIISVSYKWLGEDEVFYEDVTTQTEDDILGKLHALFNEAHFLLAHNGRRFDLKKIRARMIARGFPPHSPVRVIDTLQISKKEFGFTSNKLQYLTNLLCKRNVKSSHAKFSGYLLWREFLKGNQEAISEMREYNIIDVLSLEELYFVMAPWSSTLPNFDVYTDDLVDMGDWVEDGFAYSNLGKYKQYRNVKTGQYRRGRQNLLDKEKRKQLLANIVG